MIIRNEYKGDLALGSRLKTTSVAILDTVTEGAQFFADTATTARATMELIHGALQPSIVEQRINTAKLIQEGIKELKAEGMSEEDICYYLQVPYRPKSAIGAQ